MGGQPPLPVEHVISVCVWVYCFYCVWCRCGCVRMYVHVVCVGARERVHTSEDPHGLGVRRRDRSRVKNARGRHSSRGSGAHPPHFTCDVWCMCVVCVVCVVLVCVYVCDEGESGWNCSVNVYVWHSHRSSICKSSKHSSLFRPPKMASTGPMEDVLCVCG